MKGRRVLVAGGTGLVGVSLTRRLVDLGADVTSTSFSQTPQALADRYLRCDFTSMADCLRATEGKEIVFLTAVQASGVQGMKESPTGRLLPNLQIHAGLLEACRLNKVKTVLWVSSSTVYQEAYHPIRESELDWNTQPFALYQGMGWLYRYLEQLARLYREQAGMEVGVIRTTSIYGPHDQFDDGKAHVIPAIIKRALGREDPFVVWGRPDTVRDFIFVDDLVDAMVRMVEQGCHPEPLNVCSGHPLTVAQAVESILRVAGHAPRVEYDRTKPSAIPYRALDMTRFETFYGRPQRTPFESGVGQTVEWYQGRRAR
jgi:GDP-L-fucose synthase